MTEEQTRHRIATGTQPLFIKPTTWVCNDDISVVMPECSCRASRSLGFTLVELVIVIAIVIVLSVVSVPIYRSYVDKAKMAEGYALLGTILSAQKAYYSEYGYFYCSPDGTDFCWTSYDPNLGIDTRGNKYFTLFFTYSGASYSKYLFYANVLKPVELTRSGSETGRGDRLYLRYNLTVKSGGVFVESNS